MDWGGGGGWEPLVLLLLLLPSLSVASPGSLTSELFPPGCSVAAACSSFSNGPVFLSTKFGRESKSIHSVPACLSIHTIDWVGNSSDRRSLNRFGFIRRNARFRARERRRARVLDNHNAVRVETVWRSLAICSRDVKLSLSKEKPPFASLLLFGDEKKKAFGLEGDAGF